MTHNRVTKKLWVSAILTLGLFSSQLIYADLTLSPTRAVFDAKTRSMQIKLTNGGDKKTTYRIAFKNMRMTEEGGFEDIPSSEVEGMYAEKLVRFSPRQVTLEPGASQSVRLLTRKPKSLAEGEYRSHLLFEEVPDEAGLDLSNILKPEPGNIGVVLVPISGATIPVIVRHGKLNAEANLSDLGFKKSADKDTPSTLALQIHRNGTKSLFGDLEITHFAAGASEGVVVGAVQGVSVLAPTSKREAVMRLDVPPKHQLKGGRLVVTYRNIDEDANQQEVLAQAELPLS